MSALSEGLDYECRSRSDHTKYPAHVVSEWVGYFARHSVPLS